MTTLPRDGITSPIRLFLYVPGDAITDAFNALINDINTNFVPPGGLVPIAMGGTGQSTANAAFNALSPLTTKGDIIGFSTVNARLPVGTNGQVLSADSAQTLGIKWVTPTNSPLTTKGDVFTFDTADARLPVGTDGQVLSADSLEATGLKWVAPGGSPLTTKGDVFTFSTVNARLPVGTNGQVLSADSAEVTGLKWVAAAGAPLTTKGDLFTFDTANARLPVGTNDQMLIADSTQALGIKWLDIRTTANEWTATQTFSGTTEAVVLETGGIIRQFSSVGNNGTTILLNVADGPTGRQSLEFTTDNTTFTRKEVATLQISNDAGGSAVANGVKILARATGAPVRIEAMGTDTDVDIQLRPKGTGIAALAGGAGSQKFRVSDTGLAFFGTLPVAKPTGVAVTATGIHAALVTLGLIAA